jgi:hypothetical protein
MGKKSRSSWAERPRAPIPFKLLDSPAFLSISHAARHAFWRIVVEHGRHGGRENGRLICTHRDFEAWGIPHDLIARAIRELVAVKLIEITRVGAAGNADQRRAALYRLTCFAAVGREGGDGTHEYEQIKTMEEAVALVKAARNPVSKRDAANGRKGAATAKIQNFAPKNRGEAASKSGGENGKVPPPNLGVQGPPPNLGALSTSRPPGRLSKESKAWPITNPAGAPEA